MRPGEPNVWVGPSPRWPTLLLVVLLMVGVADACGTGGPDRPRSEPGTESAKAAEVAEDGTQEVEAPGGPGDPAESVGRAETRRLPPAQPVGDLGADEPVEGPVAVTIDALGISEAQVVPVGVTPDGDMEVPSAAEVGWYRFGPRPGDAGSAVLAAHIAYDGEDGVFRHLDRASPGDVVEVAIEDGDTMRFEIVDVAQYPKDELPAEVFDRTGEPRLALVTCGGAFDADQGAYEANVVAFAVPVT